MLEGLSQIQKEFFEQKTSMKRFATDIEIAKACMYLSSEDSSYSTGIVLDVSGGLLDV
jgi:3-oxoacyl-[acyl-carrier protein] reductase